MRTIPDDNAGRPAETRRLYRWERECERRRKERELRERVAEQKRTGEWQRAWEAMQAQKHFPTKRIVAIGKSMGGRVAAQMAAAGRLPAAALIFLGYPLHAPGKPDRLRDEHLYRIRVPMHFFAGSRDPFCNLDILNGVLARLTAPYNLEIIRGGNHAFGLPRSDERTESDIHEQIITKCLLWLKNG